MIKRRKVLPIWQRPGWRWFFSLRLGLLILAALTAASIAGTLLGPNVVGGKEVESALDRSIRLIFDSFWYKYLLLLPLAINMAFSTVRTILAKILPLRRPRFIHGTRYYSASGPQGEVPFAGDIQTAAAAYRRRGFRAAVSGNFGYASKGWLGYWGAPVSHLGFIIVLLAGFAAAKIKSEGLVVLREGEQTSMMSLKTEAGYQQTPETPLGFTLRCDDFETGFFPHTQIVSSFISTVSIKEGDRPWRTEPVEVNHSVSAGGWELHQASYQPLGDLDRYSVAFSGPGQSTTRTLELSPGQRRQVPGLADTEIALSPATGALTWTILKNGQPAGTGNLIDTPAGYRLRAIQFEPDFVMGEKIGSRSQELNNPAFKVELLKDGQPVTSEWLFGRDDMKEMMRGMHAQKGPFTYELTDVTGDSPNWKMKVAVRETGGAKVGDYTLAVGEESAVGPATKPAAPLSPAAAAGWRVKIDKSVPAYSTTLSLTRNPVLPIVYSGCALMLLGLTMTFFIRRREEWFWVDRDARRLRVVVRIRHQPVEIDGPARRMLQHLASEPAMAKSMGEK